MNFFEKLVQTDHRHLIYTHLSSNQMPCTIFPHGKGCKLCGVNGREDLDLTAELWLAQIGHGREKWLKLPPI